MTATRPLADVRSDMDLFDLLPRAVRDRLNETPSRLSVDQVHRVYASVESTDGEALATRYVMQVMDLVEANAAKEEA